MIKFKKEPKSSKCYFTHLLTEPRDDGAKPQTSKKPYSLTQSLPWAHTIDLMLPAESYDAVRSQLDISNHTTLRYSRVFMSLLDVLSGDFFTHYIKKGNILMRSSGRPRIDKIYYLQAGVLHLELDRPTYERCGLVGEAIPDGGRKHVKQRFLVKLNLRLPSMLHGNKGFERLVWAAKQVLTGDERWLFVDLDSSEGPQDEMPINQHHPSNYTVEPQITRIQRGLIPWIPHEGRGTTYEYAEQLLEWLGLIAINSPRIRDADDVDPYLCRYRIPHCPEQDTIAEKHGDSVPSDLVLMRWRGFVHPDFAKALLLSAERASISRQSWVAMNVCGLEERSYTILGTAGKEWLCWQCED